MTPPFQRLLLLLALLSTASAQDFLITLTEAEILEKYNLPEGTEILSREENSPPPKEQSTNSSTILEETLVLGERIQENRFKTDQPGSYTFQEEEIEALAGATADPNELLEILPNTQFDIDRDRFSNDPRGQNTIGDLSPTEVSISGGRPSENTFLIDGIATDNQLDTFSQRGFDSTTGSVQSVFIDTDLLGSFEVLDSNVPAEYGGFQGGVVNQKTRDPKDRLSVTLRTGYSSDKLVNYLLDAEAAAQALAEDGFVPEPTTFQRYRYGLAVDLPLGNHVKTLFSATRQVATVERGALSSNYFGGTRPRDTIRDNFLFKTKIDPNPFTSITAQTTWTPYEDQYWRSNIARQFGGGSTSKLNWTQLFDKSVLTVDLAYTTTENSREEDPNHYNFGDFLAPDGGLIGGFGKLDNKEQKIDFNIKHSHQLKNASLTYGLQSRYTRAERSRLETNFSYRLPENLGFPAVAPGEDDGSIIGSTYLTERSDFLAYESLAEIISLNLFADYSHNFILTDWFTLRPSLGLRISYDDFLGNINFAPRTSLSLKFPWNLTLTAGYNRYYAKNQLTYALREQNPPNIFYLREPVDFVNNEIILSEWKDPTINQESLFEMPDDLDTPFSDEFSLALTLPLWKLGELRLKALQRDNKKSFAGGQPIPDTFTTPDGEVIAFNRRQLSNDGFSEYRSLSLEWSKSWRNHTFSASSTISENVVPSGSGTILSSIDADLAGTFVEFFPLNSTTSIPVLYDTLEIQRLNFNIPYYVSLAWISRWFDNRLKIAFRGRYSPEYVTIREREFASAIFEEVQIPTSFIVDASITYKHELPRIGEVELDVDIDNLFDTTPSAGVSARNPYRAGRAFSFGLIYRF